jgi:hypothetical protein
LFSSWTGGIGVLIMAHRPSTWNRDRRDKSYGLDTSAGSDID